MSFTSSISSTSHPSEESINQTADQDSNELALIGLETIESTSTPTSTSETILSVCSMQQSMYD